MNDARTAMSASADLHAAAILLRQDLARIPPELARKPREIAEFLNVNHPRSEAPDDAFGYLEIIEGPNGVHPYIYTVNGELVPHPFVDDLDNHDVTVGDVDDIIAFTVRASRFRGLQRADFRGLIADDDGDLMVVDTEFAEIVWFVRGNTLYRRIRLISENDSPVSARALRQNRILHTFNDDPNNSPANRFPYPLYCPDHPNWRYLRVPTLEETLHIDWRGIPQWKTIAVPGTPVADPDLWERPHFFPSLQDRWSGSLAQFANRPGHPDPDNDRPRHVRAGEDVVLTNVLSFDIKVWCPLVGDFVNLGTPGTTWVDNNNQPLLNPNLDPNLRDSPRTWDSWSQQGEYSGTLPPYTAPLEAIQITIRCFDPASRVIKQVTVVHRFGN
jgi:hypothetical protein